MLRLHLALVAPLLSFAIAQSTTPILIEPGSRLVKPKKLPNHTATYTLYRGHGDDRTVLQEIRRSLEHVRVNGERLVRLSWHTQVMGREVVDQLTLDAKTLAPRSRVIPLPTGGTAEIAIDGDRVTGTLSDSASEATELVGVTFTAPLHDASLPLLVSLRLEEGARFRLASLPRELGDTPADPTWMTITVGAQTSLQLDGRVERDIWPITLEDAKGGPLTKIWLSKRKPYIFRKEISMPGFGVIVWELNAEE